MVDEEQEVELDKLSYRIEFECPECASSVIAEGETPELDDETYEEVSCPYCAEEHKITLKVQ